MFLHAMLKGEDRRVRVKSLEITKLMLASSPQADFIHLNYRWVPTQRWVLLHDTTTLRSFVHVFWVYKYAALRCITYHDVFISPKTSDGTYFGVRGIVRSVLKWRKGGRLGFLRFKLCFLNYYRQSSKFLTWETTIILWNRARSFWGFPTVNKMWYKPFRLGIAPIRENVTLVCAFVGLCPKRKIFVHTRKTKKKLPAAALWQMHLQTF